MRFYENDVVKTVSIRTKPMENNSYEPSQLPIQLMGIRNKLKSSKTNLFSVDYNLKTILTHRLGLTTNLFYIKLGSFLNTLKVSIRFQPVI